MDILYLIQDFFNLCLFVICQKRGGHYIEFVRQYRTSLIMNSMKVRMNMMSAPSQDKKMPRKLGKSEKQTLD